LTVNDYIRLPALLIQVWFLASHYLPPRP